MSRKLSEGVHPVLIIPKIDPPAIIIIIIMMIMIMIMLMIMIKIIIVTATNNQRIKQSDYTLI